MRVHHARTTAGEHSISRLISAASRPVAAASAAEPSPYVTSCVFCAEHWMRARVAGSRSA
eukprot:2489988-Prymnesium_polylepis.1